MDGMVITVRWHGYHIVACSWDAHPIMQKMTSILIRKYDESAYGVAAQPGSKTTVEKWFSSRVYGVKFSAR